MTKNILKKYSNDAINYVCNNSSTILSYLGAAGVVTTAIMTAKATPKALYLLGVQEDLKEEKYGKPLTKFERFLAVVPAYFPTMLMGGATMACIIGSNQISKNREAMLISAYSYLNVSYNEYKDKVKELFGDDKEKEVRAAIAKDHYIHTKNDNADITIYDEYGKRYFQISKDKYKDILYDINRMYNFTGEMTLNNFYEFFDLEPIPGGDILGWSVMKDLECCGISWIDVKLEPLEMVDNLECYVMTYNVDPSDDFGSWTIPTPY